MTNDAGLERDLVWLRPGAGKGVANGRVRILVDSESSVSVDDLWRALLERQDLADVLDLLAGSGLVGLGSFAVAVTEANERTRLLVRGSGRAAASEGHAVTTIEPHGAATWVERVVDRATHVGLWLDPAAPAPVGEEVPVSMSDLVRMLSGIAPAEAMWWATDGRSATDGRAEKVARTAVVEEPADEPAARRSTLAARRSRPSTTVASAAADLPARPRGVPSTSAVVASQSAGAREPTIDEGSTRVVGRDAPIAPVPDTPPSTPTGLIDAVPRPSPAHAEEPPEVADVSPSTAPSGRDTATTSVPGSPTDAGEEVGATIVRPRSSGSTAEPSDVTSASDPTTDAVPGQLVQASMCVRRHPNPPHAVTCGACGDELGDVLEMVQRPSLGNLRLTDGRVFELGSPVIFGTDPVAPSDLAGIDHQLVDVSGCDRVATTHAVIRLEGWHVYVEDLGTMNGTEVSLPDRPPVRVRPEDPMMLEGGAHVDLAGQYDFEFDTIY